MNVDDYMFSSSPLKISTKWCQDTVYICVQNKYIYVDGHSVEVKHDEIIVTDCFVSIIHSTHRSIVLSIWCTRTIIDIRERHQNEYRLTIVYTTNNIELLRSFISMYECIHMYVLLFLIKYL